MTEDGALWVAGGGSLRTRMLGQDQPPGEQLLYLSLP